MQHNSLEKNDTGESEANVTSVTREGASTTAGLATKATKPIKSMRTTMAMNTHSKTTLKIDTTSTSTETTTMMMMEESINNSSPEKNKGKVASELEDLRRKQLAKSGSAIVETVASTLSPTNSRNRSLLSTTTSSSTNNNNNNNNADLPATTPITMDSWYSQQRDQTKQMRKQKVHAAQNLHNYRPSLSNTSTLLSSPTQHHTTSTILDTKTRKEMKQREQEAADILHNYRGTPQALYSHQPKYTPTGHRLDNSNYPVITSPTGASTHGKSVLDDDDEEGEDGLEVTSDEHVDFHVLRDKFVKRGSSSGGGTGAGIAAGMTSTGSITGTAKKDDSSTENWVVVSEDERSSSNSHPQEPSSELQVPTMTTTTMMNTRTATRTTTNDHPISNSATSSLDHGTTSSSLSATQENATTWIMTHSNEDSSNTSSPYGSTEETDGAVGGNDDNGIRNDREGGDGNRYIGGGGERVVNPLVIYPPPLPSTTTGRTISHVHAAARTDSDITEGVTTTAGTSAAATTTTSGGMMTMGSSEIMMESATTIASSQYYSTTTGSSNTSLGTSINMKEPTITQSPILKTNNNSNNNTATNTNTTTNRLKVNVSFGLLADKSELPKDGTYRTPMASCILLDKLLDKMGSISVQVLQNDVCCQESSISLMPVSVSVRKDELYKPPSDRLGICRCFISASFTYMILNCHDFAEDIATFHVRTALRRVMSG